ncbi:MAG: 2-hydroxymuconate tautomerase [Desulfobacteraceae bacterium]
MPFVSIKIAAGRTTDQKRALVKSVTEAVASSIEVDPEKVWVQIDEFDNDNFATGGTLMIDKR